MVKENDFGSKLKRARERAGLTVRDVSVKADCSTTAIYNVENNGTIPSVAFAQRLAQAVGVELGKLL